MPGQVCQIISGSTERRTQDAISVNSRIKFQRTKRGNVFLSHGNCQEYIQRVFNTFDSLMLRWSAVEHVYCQCVGHGTERETLDRIQRCRQLLRAHSV